MSSRESRDYVLRSSRNYYAHRAVYLDLWSQQIRKETQTVRELDFLEFVFRSQAKHRVRDILDVACGGGRHIVGLAKRGYRCVGQDFTAERIQVSKARAERFRVSVRLKTGDVTKMSYTNEFDAVLALYILFLLPNDEDIKRCLKKVHRALRPGGLIVCNMFNPFTRGSSWMSEVLLKGHSIDETSAPGIKITEVMRRRSLDPVHGVMWVDETSFVEAPDGDHVFRDKERVRLLSYWETVHYLQEAGFKDVRCYPDWEREVGKKSKAEQLVFVARR